MNRTLTLTFDETEDDCFNIYCKAHELHSAIWNYKEKLRSLIKYENKAEFEPARDLLWEILKEYGVDGLF